MSLSKHCTVTTILRRFSLLDVNRLSRRRRSRRFSVWHGKRLASMKYECDSDYFNKHFKATFYPDGNCEDNGGYVSIMFKRIKPKHLMYCNPKKFSCTVSVIDASGNKRFSQSLALHQGPIPDKFLLNQDFGFERYLSRSTLLSDSPELLPDDSLKLCLEFEIEFSGLVKYNTRGFNLENDKCHLRADTEFARDLCEVSEVFQRMMESPMVERLSGEVSLPREEYGSLMVIFNFFSDNDLFVSLPDVFDLYVFADKYDMPVIVQLCHELLTAVGRSARKSRGILDCVEKHMPMILELAERFEHHERLTEILKFSLDKHPFEVEVSFIKSLKKNIFYGSSINGINQETEWSCKLVEIREYANICEKFWFRKMDLQQIKTYLSYDGEYLWGEEEYN